jgi:hypothetical protein
MKYFLIKIAAEDEIPRLLWLAYSEPQHEICLPPHTEAAPSSLRSQIKFGSPLNSASVEFCRCRSLLPDKEKTA